VSNNTHDALLRARKSAVHLEMRDSYTPNDPEYQRYLAGNRATGRSGSLTGRTLSGMLSRAE